MNRRKRVQEKIYTKMNMDTQTGIQQKHKTESEDANAKNLESQKQTKELPKRTLSAFHAGRTF